MTIREITKIVEEIAPLSYAEDFDNVGLLVGNPDEKVTGVLVALDTLESVVDEAIAKNCNLIISFHPIIFSGLKKLTGKNYVERVVIKAIQHNIAIYAIHTALDNSMVGVNAKICEILGLNNPKILIPKTQTIQKLTTYVPVKNAEKLRLALFGAGAGSIGNYDHCSFNIDGFGTYKANETANPTIGQKGITHQENETCITVIFEKHLEQSILETLFKNHPYEEVAYEMITLNNKNQHIGLGMIGELSKALDEDEFLKSVKKNMNTACVRHSKILHKKIKRVAVLGGSGSFAIENAIAAGADAFITSDLKYHEFYRAENNILLIDIGHFESEQFTKNLLVEYLTKKIANFAIILSETNTNPIYYL
ncbi:MAG: Nif3-like dinuclear metal center hexameric protein [Flavobacteriaceae bacterium]|nr:Nif3-like dinuclear metal center hexameric protein [Flavobacteriaceae bacterium]